MAGSGVFDGRRALVLGVANKRSIAWAIAQQLADDSAARPVEEPERRVLRRHERQLGILDADVANARRGHQRKLVEGERPSGAGRQHEGDAAHDASLQLTHDPVQALRIGIGEERVRARETGRSARPRRDHERVVGNSLAGAGHDGASLGVDARERVEAQRHAEVVADLVERVVARGA